MNSILKIKNVNKNFGMISVLNDINIDIESGDFLVLVGPSGCGKSTLLRCFNRMNDLVDGCSITGKILHEGSDIYQRNVEVERYMSTYPRSLSNKIFRTKPQMAIDEYLHDRSNEKAELVNQMKALFRN